MSFMLMAFLAPLPFSFLFFFLRQQHFLQMQKQQVSSSRPATTAMAISAQGGTAARESRGQRGAARGPDGAPSPAPHWGPHARCPRDTPLSGGLPPGRVETGVGLRERQPS